jgi:hypothetical protein
MKKILFTILLSFASVSFGSNFKGGNDLYEQLKSKDTEIVKYLVGSGYVIGVVDTRFEKCNFDNVVAAQLVDTVLLYLTNHPEMRQYTASSLVIFAIKEKFNCK